MWSAENPLIKTLDLFNRIENTLYSSEIHLHIITRLQNKRNKRKRTLRYLRKLINISAVFFKNVIIIIIVCVALTLWTCGLSGIMKKKCFICDTCGTFWRQEFDYCSRNDLCTKTHISCCFYRLTRYKNIFFLDLRYMLVAPFTK